MYGAVAYHGVVAVGAQRVQRQRIPVEVYFACGRHIQPRRCYRHVASQRYVSASFESRLELLLRLVDAIPFALVEDIMILVVVARFYLHLVGRWARYERPIDISAEVALQRHVIYCAHHVFAQSGVRGSERHRVGEHFLLLCPFGSAEHVVHRRIAISVHGEGVAWRTLGGEHGLRLCCPAHCSAAEVERRGQSRRHTHAEGYLCRCCVVGHDRPLQVVGAEVKLCKGATKRCALTLRLAVHLRQFHNGVECVAVLVVGRKAALGGVVHRHGAGLEVERVGRLRPSVGPEHDLIVLPRGEGYVHLRLSVRQAVGAQLTHHQLLLVAIVHSVDGIGEVRGGEPIGEGARGDVLGQRNGEAHLACARTKQFVGRAGTQPHRSTQTQYLAQGSLHSLVFRLGI